MSLSFVICHLSLDLLPRSIHINSEVAKGFAVDNC